MGVWDGAISREEWLNATPKKALKKTYEAAKLKLPFPYNKTNSIVEADVLNLMKHILDNQRIFWKRIQVQGQIRHTAKGAIQTPSSMTGMPDIIGIYEGKFLGCELKRPGGLISAQQLGILKDINKNGGIGIIVVNPEKLFNYLVHGEKTCELEGVAIV